MVFRKVVAIRRAGRTYEEMVAALFVDPETAEWTRTKGSADNERELKRIWEMGEDTNPIRLGDFYALMPSHSYIWVPTREIWAAASVNARIPPIPALSNDGSPKLDDKGKPASIAATAWLDRNRPVEQMTWAPGMPELVKDKIVIDGGMIDRPGVNCFNSYRPPSIEAGNPARVGPWLDHIAHIYPDAAEHILDWLANRVQRPHEKINHALVLGGASGIGKDTLLEPIRYAVGIGNFKEASPRDILTRWNDFLKSVVLRVNEARDLGEFERIQFYDHMKAYTASPPDTLRIDEKHLRQYYILNCCGVIITTNHKTDGIYLAPDDRRHFVAWSDRLREDERFSGSYWNDIWQWYENGGHRDVAAFLLQRDLSSFNPKAPPQKTAAFWAIADASQAPEEAEIADLLDKLGEPDAITLAELQCIAADTDGPIAEWLKDRRNRRIIPNRLERCGYIPMRNPDANDGLWKLRGKRQAVYAKRILPPRDQIAAARGLGQPSQ